MAPQNNLPGGNVNLQQGQSQGDGGGLQGETSVQTEPQLLQNLITRLGVDLPDSASINELGDYLATGFLEQEEVDLIMDLQNYLRKIRRGKRLIGVDKDQATYLETEVVTRMIMISQASKSKGGRGVQAVRTEIVQQMRDLYEKQELGEEEQGMLDKLLDKMDGTQVTGNPSSGQMVSDQRNQRAF
jgi:hypothetical protein